ncbi:MAG: riboflavin biosynthesis protein RibF [Dehalococcoidia bacterium]|nr:riboflavin biosynthesis protein RibF [Dehalococcoidia bacterium]
MPIARELADFTPTKPTLLTVGVFDGVHIGHQALLQRLASQATRLGLIPGVITFREHPLALLSPHEAPLRLANWAENISIIKALGTGMVIPLTFDDALSLADARTFALLLQHHLKMKGLILGWDFAMGHHREGTLAALAELGSQLGFTTEVMPAVTLGSETVSSTAIRQALAEGNVSKARAMLGRPFSLEGHVVTGAGRGAGLGFPTANLCIDAGRVVPAEGVYASRAHLDGESHPSVTAISQSPTFGGVGRTVEIHLLEFTGNIYHRTLRLDMIEYLRPPRRFEGAEVLSAQIAHDIAQAREILSATGCR